MPLFNAEREEIERLKARIEAERNLLGQQVAELVPVSRKAVLISSTVWGLRKYWPLLRPVALGLVQRAVARTGKGRALTIVALVGGGYAAWRMTLSALRKRNRELS